MGRFYVNTERFVRFIKCLADDGQCEIQPMTHWDPSASLSKGRRLAESEAAAKSSETADEANATETADEADATATAGKANDAVKTKKTERGTQISSESSSSDDTITGLISKGIHKLETAQSVLVTAVGGSIAKCFKVTNNHPSKSLLKMAPC